MNEFFIPFKNNKKLLKRFLTQDEIKLLNNELAPEQMLIYNKKMINWLYSIKDSADVENLKPIISKNIDKINKKVIKSDTRRYGLIIVKPEMLKMEDDLVSFLENKDFVIKNIIRKKISRRQFMMLYKRQLTSPETQYDLPTRMINLINKTIHIFVVTSKKCNNCSEELNRFKGKLGVIDDYTIRGIGANHINNVIKNASDQELSYIDPIQMCRGNVKYDFGKDNSVFINLENPLLFFIANCVHIPDYKELEEHTKILLNQREINKFINDI